MKNPDDEYPSMPRACAFHSPAIGPAGRRHYDGATKLRAVLRLLEGEKQVEVAHAMGISQPLLSIWKRRAMEAVSREFKESSSNRATKTGRSTHVQEPDEPRNPDLARTLTVLTQQLGQTITLLDNRMQTIEQRLRIPAD